MTKDLAKRIVLVPGASSGGGVGWVAARRFAARGAKVVVAARRIDTVQKLAASIDGVAIVCDISDEARAKSVATRLGRDFGQVHAVVNSVGRVAAANEIAAAAEWLCDEDCFMTGTLIPVDGGNHLRRAPFPDEMPASSFDVAPN